MRGSIGTGVAGGREGTADIRVLELCSFEVFVHASRRHQGQHKSKSCRLVSVVFLAGACDLRGSGVRGGVCLTSGVIRLMVGKSYPAPRKFGA